MGIDVNMVHQIGRALAVQERNEINRKHPGSRDAQHQTWAETNRKAAQNTIALLVLIFIATFLFKLLIFLGRLSLKVFGPKWGWVVNIVGLILLVLIPYCTIKVSDARAEAAAAEAAEQNRIRQNNYEKQKNAEIEAYRSEVREKVDALSEKCKTEGIPFGVIVRVYEENSRLSWNPSMTDGYARDVIDRAYKACEEAINKHYTDKIWKVESYINKLVSDLSSKVTADAYCHVAQFRNKMGNKDKSAHYVLNYNVSYDKIKKQIDMEYQFCVDDIRAANGFKPGVDPLTPNSMEEGDSATSVAIDGKTVESKVEEDKQPSVGSAFERDDKENASSKDDSQTIKNQKEILIKKLSDSRSIERAKIQQYWDEIYGDFAKERMSMVLDKFDKRTTFDADDDLDEAEELEQIRDAANGAVREIREYQAEAVECYKGVAAEKVKKCADEFLGKTNTHPSAVDLDAEVRTRIEYARDRVGPNGIACFGVTFKQAKKKLDDATNDAIEQMNLVVAKAGAKKKIDQYVKECESSLKSLAKKDIYHRGDYYVDVFSRKMIPSSIGGVIDYDAPFSEVKQRIDEEYCDAERKINDATKK